MCQKRLLFVILVGMLSLILISGIIGYSIIIENRYNETTAHTNNTLVSYKQLPCHSDLSQIVICHLLTVPIWYVVNNTVYNSKFEISYINNQTAQNLINFYRESSHNITIVYQTDDPNKWVLKDSNAEGSLYIGSVFIRIFFGFMTLFTCVLFYGLIREYLIKKREVVSVNSIELANSSDPVIISSYRQINLRQNSKKVKIKRENLDSLENSENSSEKSSEYGCKICFDKRIDAILNCGHSGCRICFEDCKTTNGKCPFCKTQITSINPIYFS